MHSVTHWYTSGTFWAAASVVVGLIVGGLTLWVTYMVGSAARKLVYSMPIAAPLLATPPGVSSDVEVRHRGRVLVHPQVPEVRLSSHGRRDIRSDDFDGGKPLRLDVAIPIVSLLDWKITPGGDATDPAVHIRGSALEIGPSLIPRREITTFHLLADGENPYLTCDSPLGDVKVTYAHYRDYRGMDPKTATRFALAMYSALLPLGAVVAGLVMGIPVLTATGLISALALLYVLIWSALIASRKQSRERGKGQAARPDGDHDASGSA